MRRLMTVSAAIAATSVCLAEANAARTPKDILAEVNSRIEREFISADGLMLDYVGDIPTPEEIADLKPNAMGWWSPIENGSMFTGEWLPSLMAEGEVRKPLVERCVKGLLKMSEVSDVPGFIARGTGTDGVSHHPCGSNDQTDPWFLGLIEYCRWQYADPKLRACVLDRLVFVAKALEANRWGVPCDGAFKGENRGNLMSKAMPFWGTSRLMYTLKSLSLLTGDSHWEDVYKSVKAGALDAIESGGEVDVKVFKICYTSGVWIYVATAQALARLVSLEENESDRARMKKGLLLFASKVAPLMRRRSGYANTFERPFRYANWRTGYKWRPQKTQKDAASVAASGDVGILGERKEYERERMSVPLAAAAICALSDGDRYREEILLTLRHYDYATPNISEFFHAAIAAAAVPERAQRSYDDTTWWDPHVEDITDADTYLRRKFRQDVTDKATGLSQDGIAKRLEEIVAAGKASGEPWRITKAKCFAAEIEEQSIDVSPLDWFPAIAIWERRKAPIRMVFWKRAQEVNAKTLSADIMAEWSAGNENGDWTMWQDFDHSVPDWRTIMRLGFPGMKARLEKYAVKGDPFYDGLKVAMDAMLKGIDRFIEQGRKSKCKIENGECKIADAHRLEKEIACLERLRSGPPQTAYDAMMFIWLYFFWSEHLDGIQCRSLTELDVFLTPYYDADVAAGRTTEAEFREQLKHFLWQWGSVANYWNQPVGFGGTKKDGTTELNHVSKIILDVMDECALTTPKFLVKVAPNTPDWAWDKMLDMARRHRSIAFIGEEPAAKAMKKWMGANDEECRTMVARGCYEYDLADSCNRTGCGHVNFLKPVEKMLEECRVEKEKCKVGGTTLNSRLSTFNSFKAEYLRRLADVTDRCRKVAFEFEKVLPEVNPANLMTLSTEYALKTRKDGFANGCPHGNNSAILAVGVGTAVDALLAVKELVYEKKEMSLAELGGIMSANWAGHEALRTRILRSRRKWGNNDPEANALGAELIDAYASQLNGKPNSRGGVFLSSGHCARQFIDLGKKTGATPDGRKAAEEMSKNVSPAMGADTEGPTALVATLAASDVTKLPADYPLDMMLHPSVCQGEKGLKAMRSLVEIFHRNGGSVIQFTVFSADELKDAQLHPEKYENLQVRVCGWNVRWNDMCKAEQDAYIRRAENVMKGW